MLVPKGHATPARRRTLRRAVQLAAALLPLASLALAAEGEGGPELNGFALGGARVPAAEILPGGPKRDGVKSVDAPKFVPAAEAKWVAEDTLVIGLVAGGEARAYPIHVIEYHQVVNDVIDGQPVVVTYDPLDGMPIAYRRRLGDRVLAFGVSGLIYKANFLLYDRETQSLWSQYLGEAISGPLAGRKLERLRVRQEPMGVWLERQPDTEVLALPRPEAYNYSLSPFTAYWISESTPKGVTVDSAPYHPKEVVLGLEADGKARAYLGSILTAAGGRIVDDFAGHHVRIAYDSETSAFQWGVPADVRVTDAYWFAWKNFHPDTEIWSDTRPPDAQP
jgi:hypothetical protein